MAELTLQAHAFETEVDRLQLLNKHLTERVAAAEDAAGAAATQAAHAMKTLKEYLKQSQSGCG